MPHIDAAWIALIGTLCGGLGLKLLEHWLGKSKVKMDEAGKLRDELRIEINALREEQRLLEQELNKWKLDYFDLRDKYSTLNTEYLIALEKIKRAAESVAETIDPPAST